MFIGCDLTGTPSRASKVTNSEPPAITNAQTPTIGDQPIGDTYTQGQTATLSVTASVTDDGTLTYQWYSADTEGGVGSPIDGETSKDYAFTANKLGITYYWVVVTNTNNSVSPSAQQTATIESDRVAIEVVEVINAQKPNIDVHPQSATYNVGDPVTPLSVGASVSDEGTLSYQWYIHTENSNSGGSPVTNDTADQTFTPIQSGYYYVVVTNTNNNVNGTKTASEPSNAVQIVIPYYVSFYNDQLDFIETKIEDGTIDPSSLFGSGTWYKANESSETTEHNLTANINFYALSNVHEIYTQADLNNTRNNPTHNYIMFDNIELTSETLGNDGGAGWNPIGEFKGLFNGNEYAIRNLWINRPSVDRVGLFGYINSGAKIRNLGVEIDSSKGGVTGHYHVGAIAGRVSGSSSITNSYSTGNVSGTNNVGGIAGYVYNNSSITNSYSTGNVSGDEHVGGIAGEVISSSTTIANNAAINQKINESSYVNRIVGDPGYSNVKNNFALDTMTINGGYSSNVGDLRYSGTPKLIDKLTTQETYSADPTGGLGWKFGNDKDNPWKIDEGNGYPYLYWQKIAP